MNTEIKFGTDGFRGIIAKDFTFEIVEKIICAISIYLRKNFSQNTIIIGFDPRFMAQEFAEFASNLFMDFGFSVILSSKVVPTPIVAYCAKNCPDSLGAVMFTASHNPKTYQGIKFIPNYGGPATKEITDEILKYIDDTPPKKAAGKITKTALEEKYFEHLEKIIDFDIIKKNPPKIIFDGLYCASIGYFDKILDKHNISYKSFNMHHSSDFGGGLPEPKDKFLKNRSKNHIVLANDGDADRFGVIDENMNYVHPNIILALLIRYLAKKNPSSSNTAVKTVGVSSLFDLTAKLSKVNVIETKVGFKWLSSEMRKLGKNCLLAGEDSGGLSLGCHIPEKDGILANLLILEMLAAENKTLVELQRDLKNFTQAEFFQDRVDIKVKNEVESDNIIERFKNLNKIADFEIKAKNTLDGEKFYLNDDKTRWILIRKSGTEPLLRFYIETTKRSEIEKIKDFINQNCCT